MGVMLNRRVVHNFVVEMFFDSVPNFKRTRGDCYIIYDYANVRFNNNHSQLKNGARAEEEEEEEDDDDDEELIAKRVVVGLTYWQRDGLRGIGEKI